MHPGISSFAYLAAKAGVSYQDAKLVSIHGCSGDKKAADELINSVRYNEKTFVLLSGADDVKLMGRAACRKRPQRCQHHTRLPAVIS